MKELTLFLNKSQHTISEQICGQLDALLTFWHARKIHSLLVELVEKVRHMNSRKDFYLIILLRGEKL
jgi:hypothetical protein